MKTKGYLPTNRSAQNLSLEITSSKKYIRSNLFRLSCFRICVLFAIATCGSSAATLSASGPGTAARAAFCTGVARARTTARRRPRGLLLSARSAPRIRRCWTTDVLVTRRVVSIEKTETMEQIVHINLKCKVLISYRKAKITLKSELRSKMSTMSALRRIRSWCRRWPDVGVSGGWLVRKRRVHRKRTFLTEAITSSASSVSFTRRTTETLQRRLDLFHHLIF